jgi:hypothetical protein
VTPKRNAFFSRGRSCCCAAAAPWQRLALDHAGRVHKVRPSGAVSQPPRLTLACATDKVMPISRVQKQ